MQNILFFGDSLTAGYGLKNPDGESFPGLIQKKIDAAGFQFKVINAGLSGDTSAGGIVRLDYWLSRPISVFVLELGINDILRGVSPQVTFRNLTSIITKVKSRHPRIKIALMGMEIPEVIAGSMASEFRSIFRKLADTHKLAFVPFFLLGVAGQRHLNLADGLHPSAQGYSVIATHVWPVLERLLT
jgi:acyl-CoA thioesterase I